MMTSGEKMQVWASLKRCSSHWRPGQLVADVELDDVSVNEANLRARIHEVSGPAQRPRGELVVRGDQDAVVSVRPVEQAFVERGDVASVDGMDDHVDPVV